MNQLLCIVGPTGTGKTAKAIELSRQKPSIIISADSRQVYRGMDIVTGKDHPKDVQIFGIDIVDPDEPCSVSVWYNAVIPIIQNSDPNIQIIVVGGTGLFVKALTNGIPTMSVPINQPLRDELEVLSIPELQDKLKTLDPAKLASMNNSDENNSRRLIRAIEVVGHPSSNIHIPCEVQMLGLRQSNGSNHRTIIVNRVKTRLDQGAIEETSSLLKKYTKDLQSMSAIGYRNIIKFIENKCTMPEMIESWVADELAYAKRQLTWFRKQPVIWYDVDTYGNTKN